MNDRELLELAAKAAGLDVMISLPESSFLVVRLDHYSHASWNPLNDDADALRLAVGLNIHFRQYKGFGYEATQGGYVEASHGKEVEVRENIGTNKNYATHRAIVRAAAEIGKAMP